MLEVLKGREDFLHSVRVHHESGFSAGAVGKAATERGRGRERERARERERERDRCFYLKGASMGHRELSEQVLTRFLSL